MSLAIVTMVVALTVQVRLVTPTGAPAVGVPMRLVVDKAPVSRPEAGTRCTTDAEGMCILTLSVPLNERRRKMPTNWLGSLTARPQRTRHVALGIEMAYAGQPWLAVLDVDRFDDGSSLYESAPRVFGRDASGAFTVEAAVDQGTRVALLPGGLRLSVPGFDVQSASLTPQGAHAQPDESQWMLAVLLRLRPEPVRRD